MRTVLIGATLAAVAALGYWLGTMGKFERRTALALTAEDDFVARVTDDSDLDLPAHVSSKEVISQVPLDFHVSLSFEQAMELAKTPLDQLTPRERSLIADRAAMGMVTVRPSRWWDFWRTRVEQGLALNIPEGLSPLAEAAARAEIETYQKWLDPEIDRLCAEVAVQLERDWLDGGFQRLDTRAKDASPMEPQRAAMAQGDPQETAQR